MLYTQTPLPKTKTAILTLLNKAQKLPRGVDIHYPSRGQTSVQELYETRFGKIFLKRVSERNHKDCQVNPALGTLAEREFWCFRLAQLIGLNVPDLRLLDENTTVQKWLNLSDAHTYSTALGRMSFDVENVFDCSLFDWVTGQVDRHDANYLYDYVNQKIILIDSAHSLLKYTGSLPDYLKLYEFSESQNLNQTLETKISNQLKKITPKQLCAAIPLRNDQEKQAILDRHAQIQTVNSLNDILRLYRSGK